VAFIVAFLILGMHLRPMHSSDIPDIADLWAEAQLEDELVAFVAPYRKTYYRSYRDNFVRRIRARRLKPGSVLWVAETDEGDEPTVLQKSRGEPEVGGRIVGYAAWTRVGNSPVAKKWQRMNQGRFTSECIKPGTFEIELSFVMIVKTNSLADASSNPSRFRILPRTA
jgi:hypothetical protein